MVEFSVAGPGSAARPRSVRIQKFIPNTQRALPMREYSETNIRIPTGRRVSGLNPPHGARAYNGLIQETPATWGYMLPDACEASWDDLQNNFFMNLYIMPLHGDPDESRLQDGSSFGMGYHQIVFHQ